MKIALRLFLFSVLSSMVVAAGCDGDDGDGTSTTTTTTTADTTTTTTSGMGGMGGDGGGGGGNAVMVPMLGEQIERMGRPAINTALNHTFDADMATKEAAKDAWNEALPPDWASFVPQVADNLGILDSLDANCGNQLLAEAALSATRYDPLAGILADDRIWLKTNAVTCDEYLGVEAAAVGVPINDCGGRRLTDDVIERSYSVLAAGILNGIDDTISADPVKTGGTMFPHLADPL